MRILMVLFCLSFPMIAFANHSLPAGEDKEAVLGMGFDSEKEKFTGTCLKGKLVRRGKQEANVAFEQSLDQNSMKKELGIDAGTRFRYGEATVKASAKFMKSSRSDGFSISAVYSGDYKFKNDILYFEDSADTQDIKGLEKQRLTDIGKAVRNDDDRWRETCGDEYVTQIVRGAKLFYSIKIEFLTQEEKDLFETAFSYDSTFASVKASLKNISENFSKRTKITVGALQIGGDTRKITELFFDNKETGDSSSMGFVKCSFGDLAKCDQVMANAIRYATKDFKDQLESKPDQPSYEGGPADLRYITAPYADAGIFPKFSSILTAAVRAKRWELETLFDRLMDNLGTVNSLLTSSSVVLSPRQNGLLKTVKQELDKDVRSLILAAETCYNSVEECVATADSITPKLSEFDENSVIILPETFRQYCARSESTLSTKKLSTSIRGMLDAAREIEPDSFSSDPGGKTDSCLQAHNVFMRNNEIRTFSGKKISTLVPLQEYSHFVAVDFSENSIDDLEPLHDWKNLEELDLGDNKIRDLVFLERLVNLRLLSLSNNHLRDISLLTKLPMLERVDARNNFETVSCQSFSQDVVCLSATVRTDAKFVHTSTTTSRPLFMPSLVDLRGGEFLVLSDNQDVQTYRLADNSFSITGRLSLKSRGRVATQLADGDILITGGWLSGNSLAIYNPELGQMMQEFKGLQVQRVGHTSTLLDDGRVLLAGGWEGGVSFSGTDATYTAEVFDPETNSTYPVGNLHAPRAWHTATKLFDGKVLIVGGFDWSSGIATAEIFDPETNEFTQLEYSMAQGRGAHSATVLASGKILLAGGFDLGAQAIDRAELFDPAVGKFLPIKETLNWARGMHSAVRLNNGKVLLAGGSVEPFAPDHPVDFTPNDHIDRGELYDPVENSFMKVPGKMAVPRARHGMYETKPGTVLIMGGLTWESANKLEIFNYVDVNTTSPLQ